MNKQLFLLLILSVSVLFNTYAIRIEQDSAHFDQLGYDNCDMIKNGELDVVRELIQPDAIVFDVGANQGEWSKHVLNMQPSITVYAFEPAPVTCTKLRLNFANLKNVHIFNIALSKEVGKKTFFWYNTNQQATECCGLYHRPIIDQIIGTQPTHLLVDTDTLTLFCQRHTITTIDFLKIDTEGSEFDILLGAYEFLANKQARVIQFEYGGTYPDSHTTLKEVYTLLTSLNYTLYRIVPWGLIEITQWRTELETFKYANYIAAAQPLSMLSN